MTKRVPLKEKIKTTIEKRYKIFEALGKESKALDNDKDRDKIHEINIKMRELVLDMECMENYVLKMHPEMTQFWYALKDWKGTNSEIQ